MLYGCVAAGKTQNIFSTRVDPCIKCTRSKLATGEVDTAFVDRKSPFVSLLSRLASGLVFCCLVSTCIFLPWLLCSCVLLCRMLGLPWAFFGPLPGLAWDQFWASGGLFLGLAWASPGLLLGSPLAGPGGPWAPLEITLGGSWASLGPPLGCSRPLWGRPGGFLGLLWGVLGGSWPPKASFHETL